MVQGLARADRNAGQRRLGPEHRHPRLGRDHLGKAPDQRPAAGQQDAVARDIGRELRRGLLEGVADPLQDLAQRPGDRGADLFAVQLHPRRQAGHEVTAADLGHLLGPERDRRAELDLDRLGRARSDRQLVDRADVVRDRVVHLIAADPDRARDDDPAERDDRHLARAPADVDDHPAERLLDRQPGADRGGDRLLDQVHLARAGGQRGLLDRPLLDLGHPRRRAHDQPRVGHAPVEHLADEVAQHLLGHLEVGDHAVAQRAGRGDRRRRAADHPLGLGADGVDLAGRGVGGDDRGLGDDDPPPPHVHERVGRAEVDRHVVDPEGGDEVAP